MQWFIDNRPAFRELLQKFHYFLRDSFISVVAGPRFEPAKLRVLVTWPCYGYAALQLADRIGENVVVTETRVADWLRGQKRGVRGSPKVAGIP